MIFSKTCSLNNSSAVGNEEDAVHGLGVGADEEPAARHLALNGRPRRSASQAARLTDELASTAGPETRPRPSSSDSGARPSGRLTVGHLQPAPRPRPPVPAAAPTSSRSRPWSPRPRPLPRPRWTTRCQRWCSAFECCVTSEASRAGAMSLSVPGGRTASIMAARNVTCARLVDIRSQCSQVHLCHIAGGQLLHHLICWKAVDEEIKLRGRIP